MSNEINREIGLERYEIAEILAQNFRLNDEQYDASDFEWAAHCLLKAGYRKQSEGEWMLNVDGTHWCSECGHDATYTYDGVEVCGVACPFCGAKMKG